MKFLYRGDQGTLVEYLQLALTRAGFETKVDGIMGEKTCDALNDFLGGAQECVVNKEVWQKLIPYLNGAASNQENKGIVPENVKYTSKLLDWILEGLTKRYPFLEQGTIGRSVMGKQIPYIKIGNGEKEVCYNASFHANESITTPVLLKFAEEYAQAYAEGGRLGGVEASMLYRTYTLYLIPMVNPDGVDLVNGILNYGIFFRKAQKIAADYPWIPFPSGWKANMQGIDLNLQFPAGWEDAKRIKFSQGYVSPAPRDYVGSAPLVAPESNAVFRFTQNHNFMLILAYHTQGEVIYWKYLDYEPQNSREIAEYFGEVSGYTVELTPGESGNAGYKDWFIQDYNRPGYTIEVGLGENPLPMSQFEGIYKANKGILLGGMIQI